MTRTKVGSKSKGRELEEAGDTLADKGKFEKAIKKYSLAITQFVNIRPNRDYNSIGRCHKKMAECFIELEKFEKAIAEYDRAAHNYSKVGRLRDYSMIGECHEKRGDLFIKLNQLEEAKDAYDNAIGNFVDAKEGGSANRCRGKLKQVIQAMK